ncbi:MAG: M48 family metalloprotease [Myxococcales bacterium]|nr:M48 family metalloprotease [Myxococcales bacterium]
MEMATMSDYPAGPAEVPSDLTRPGPAYRRHAYLAVAGLALFIAAYLGLTAWFAWAAVRMWHQMNVAVTGNGWWALGSAGTAFLALFMLKALVFVRRGKPGAMVELTRADHPRLFAFLDRVAADARAPRPHRVFVSPEVNAAVFYDLTVLNLLWPSRKNLVIGLGVVNTLNLSELKAVLAHEFGHFAQRSMAVGRWVYTAQQIAAHIVVRRDILDRFLRGLSNIDLRLAWIGWLLRAIVWAIRALVDTVFSVVILAERALSREMELQADLVAVSLTGSEPLIHALHRLGAADDALDRALAFTADEAGAGRRVADLFALQTEMVARKRQIRADPTWGEVPAPRGDAAAFRLFKAQLASPPRMWSTHPPNDVREDNAKRRFVTAPIDPRSAWTLFDDPDRMRREVTAWLYRDEPKPTQPTPMAETLATLDRALARRALDPAYRGAYLGRSVTRAAHRPAQLVDAPGVPTDRAGVLAALAALYPPTLTAAIEEVDELETEAAMLRAIQRGAAEAPGGLLRYRGEEHRRRDLPALLARVEAALAAARRVVTDHDRQVRATHLTAAGLVGAGWDQRLRGQLAVVHYADHTAADLEDAMAVLQHELAIAFADRSLSSAEIDRLVVTAGHVHAALATVFAHAPELELSPEILARFEATRWAAVLGEFALAAPHRANIGPWLDAIDAWVRVTGGALEALRDHALEELLATEEEVAAALAAERRLPDAPPPMRAPRHYATMVIGAERPRQTLGWWDRFQIADGLGPTLLRLVVAGGIVGAVIWASP